MASDAMTVRLHLPQIRVLEVLEDAPGACGCRKLCCGRWPVGDGGRC